VWFLPRSLFHGAQTSNKADSYLRCTTLRRMQPCKNTQRSEALAVRTNYPPEFVKDGLAVLLPSNVEGTLTSNIQRCTIRHTNIGVQPVVELDDGVGCPSHSS
jgi:hypothetical protein